MSEPSVNSKARLLGDGGTGDKQASPLPGRRAGQPAAPPVSIEPPAAASAQALAAPVFLGDSADGSDVLNAAQVVEPLAQLCVTREVQTPFLAAILGASGAGKTFALRRLAQTIDELSVSPARAGGALRRVVLARVDASSGVEAPVAIASAAYAALDGEPGGVDYSALLDETGHAGGDPRRAAKAASDRHDDLIGRLEAERSQRDDVEAKRARLADTLAFDTPGSRLDVFARARRGTIEAHLRRFGLSGSDADSSYRSLARDMSTLGAGARAAIVIRSIWAYRSQARLIMWAIVAFVLAFLISLLHRNAAVDAIGGLHDSLKPVAGWMAAHAGLFDRASQILTLLGALAIALNLWRALTFSNLLLRGSRLLTNEVRERRRDLDGRVARLTQRVAALTAEADAAAKRAEAASQRAGGKPSTRAPGPEFLDSPHAPSARARAFLAALGARIGRAAQSGPAPDRLIVMVDNLDALPPATAVAWIDAAQGVIGPGSVGLLAFDPGRLAPALGDKSEARRRFGKWLQVALNLPPRGEAHGGLMVARLLSGGPEPAPAPDPAIATALAEPLTAAEMTLLGALAPLAAHSPRDAKRFLNAYRLARCSNGPRPVTALMLAAAFGPDDARAALGERLASGSGELGEAGFPPALAEAVKTARAANGGPISIEDARAAAEVARRYALPL